MTDYLIIFITTGSKEESERIANALIDEKLIACANIIDPVRSCFFWEGKKRAEMESLLILKTHRRIFRTLEARVKAIHSYQVPEIIAIPIVEGSSEYLQWMEKIIQ
jgi:periplasmic divalent cation tolerance protein